MNKKLKAGLTLMTAGALAFSSVAAFADATGIAVKGNGSILDLMLKDGVVTQAQIDSYQEKADALQLTALKTNIQTLVTNGTLTQAKADAVYKALVEEKEARKAEREKFEAMTDAEKEALKAEMDAKRAEMEATRTAEKAAGTTTDAKTRPEPPQMKNSALSALVENGTLTSTELEAIQKVIGGGHGDMKGGRGMKGERPADSTKTTTTTTTSAQQNIEQNRVTIRVFK